MTTVNNTNSNIFAQLGIASQSASSASSASGVGSSDMGQGQFMDLMIAQLKNQDPLKPMDNGQFLAQLAQFQTATGVQKINQSFGHLSSALNSNQALQASTLVGRSVLAPSSVGVLGAGGTVDGTVDLPASSGDLALNVYDGSGQLVRHIDMGAQPAGSAAFSWDGKDSKGKTVAPGAYKIEAIDQSGGQNQALSTNIKTQVDSVTLGQSGSSPVLNLAGLGPIDFSKIKQVM